MKNYPTARTRAHGSQSKLVGSGRVGEKFNGPLKTEAAPGQPTRGGMKAVMKREFKSHNKVEPVKQSKKVICAPGHVHPKPLSEAHDGIKRDVHMFRAHGTKSREKFNNTSRTNNGAIRLSGHANGHFLGANKARFSNDCLTMTPGGGKGAGHKAQGKGHRSK